MNRINKNKNINTNNIINIIIKDNNNNSDNNINNSDNNNNNNGHNKLLCPYCGGEHINRNGHKYNRQRYICRDCGKSFSDGDNRIKRDCYILRRIKYNTIFFTKVNPVLY